MFNCSLANTSLTAGKSLPKPQSFGLQQQFAKPPSSSFGNARNIWVGIDLGTTNSCISAVVDGKPKVFEGPEGERTTPSIVAFEKDGTASIGNVAKRQLVTNAKNTIYSAKRLIGRQIGDAEVQKMKNVAPFHIVPTSTEQPGVKTTDGTIYSPSEIGAYVLKKLKADAERVSGQEVTHAVITVPAYFDARQRRATQAAGEIAGLKVERLINEPTAAALAYGWRQDQDGKVIAVYDLGGGTFDCSVLEISAGMFEVKATHGDNFLGGDDFDNVLMNHIIDKFKKEKGIDLKDDKNAAFRIREAAEKAKFELDHKSSHEVNLPYITVMNGEPVHLTTVVKKADFENLVEPLLKRTEEAAKICLKNSGLKKKPDTVLLVGGMTRMPKVRQKVFEIFGLRPSTEVNPDEAVAVGAAVQADIIKQMTSMAKAGPGSALQVSASSNQLMLIDVTPLTLGIKLAGGDMAPVVKRNSQLPTTGVLDGLTNAEDYATSVSVDVYQGENKLADQNTFLGSARLEGLEKLPTGGHQFQVKFKVDVNGVVEATATDMRTKKSVQTRLSIKGDFSQADMDKMIESTQKKFLQPPKEE